MGKKSLLIVEDSEDALFCLAMVTEGWAVKIAKDFKTAEAFLLSKPFDLVITDFNFPGGNGHDVADLARDCGNQTIYLHSSDVEAHKDASQRYDIKFEKLDRGLLKLLKAEDGK